MEARERLQRALAVTRAKGLEVSGVVGDADPWEDLWFYSNPIWVLPPTSGH